jgi:hypothetical protein
MTVLSAAARLNVSKTAVPRTPDAPAHNDALTDQNYEQSEHLTELTCYNDLHMQLILLIAIVLPTPSPSRKCHHNDNQ